MKENIDIYKLAGDIFDLDQKVCEAVGSNLGHVFNGAKESIITAIVNAVEDRDLGTLRSEIALIGNMARNIEEPDVRKARLTEYSLIMDRFSKFTENILREDSDNDWHKSLNLLTRFQSDDNIVISIGRTYGSGGEDIAFAVADTLHINYLDADVLQKMLSREDIDETVDEAEYIKKLYTKRTKYNEDLDAAKEAIRNVSRYHGLPTRDAIFFKESKIITEMAKKGSLVVVGRGSDTVLTNAMIPHVSIFITAPIRERIRRAMKVNNVSYNAAKKKAMEADQAHRSMYTYYTGKEWGATSNYDLCLNTSVYGIEGSVELIIRILKEYGIMKK